MPETKTAVRSEGSFSPGLEGVVAAKSGLCQIDGQAGKLFYLGYPIEELAQNSTFEEVCFLLWNRRLPKKEELAALEGELKAGRSLPPRVLDFIRLLPKEARPMDVLRTTASLLGCFEKDSEKGPEANLRRSVSLTAKFPALVAAFHRVRSGQNPVEPNPRLSHAGNFLYMLSGKEPDDTQAKVMDVALILHADHEMNASTFASLVTVSTLSDIYSAVASGVGALKGPLHGGANEAVLNTVQKIADPSKVGSYVEEALAKKEKIMGFGHRIYKNYDPRARIFKEYARRLSEGTSFFKLFQIASGLEEEMKKRKSQQGIFPNVDLYSGTVYHTLGIPSDLFTPIFAVARVAGWTAHILEYLQENRLFRPNALYTGPSPRSYVSISQR